MKAYVLVNAELGQEKHVTDEVEKIEEVLSVYYVYGVYDIIVEIETGSKEDLKSTIFDKIRRIKKIKNTITLLTYGDPVTNP